MSSNPRSEGASALRRPFTALTAVGTIGHHAFEVRSGVGLVFEPFLGRAGSRAFWATMLPAWIAGAFFGRGEPIEKWLALNNGAAFSGGLVHFIQWPWETRAGVPYLTEAEGMSEDRLPAYNTVLHFWIVAGALALALETPKHARKWALAGILMGELLRRSAIHHFKWAREQARENPDQWSAALREQPDTAG
jgi:hypothetical protein